MELRKTLIEKVEHYQPSQAAIDQVREAPILFVAGITGVGKNTIQRELLMQYPDDYRFIVSHTTRAPRENSGQMERDGVEYHFVDFAAVEQMLDKGEFVEAKIVHFDNIYGTSFAEIKKAQAESKIAVTDLDVKGVKEYVGFGMNVKPVFLMPPNYAAWRERLELRGGSTIDRAELRKRMRTALAEIENALNADYFYIVINDDLQDTVDLTNRIAHGEAVEPHYQKAMAIAGDFVTSLQVELASLENSVAV